MSTLLHLTVFTGQQLVLDGLHRWLARPACGSGREPAEARQQRRQGLKSLLMLLLKTAATGVAATILDAAIDYRRWAGAGVGGPLLWPCC